jgi:single-strand DNA-binding protein
MNLNKALIIGNLTRDPETRSLPSGQIVVTFGVATNRRWTDPQGQRQEHTEFHNIVTFGKLAELCSQYLAKGRVAMIEGRLQTRSWQGQDGAKRSRTEIVADNIQFGPRPAGGAYGNAGNSNQSVGGSQHGSSETPSIQYTEDSEPINPDEMPF